MKQEWQETTLNDICININDGDWIERKDQSKEGIRLIQTGNVGNGIFLDKNNRARFISKKTFKRLNCTEIFQNDCLVSRLPDPIGRACLVPKLKQQMITAVDCAILKFNLKKIDPKFFIYYSISSKYTSQVNECITGSTRQRISKSKLSAINISIPNLLSEQKRIVKILDKAFEDIEKIKENAKQNLQNSKSLFQSYLNKIFTENTEKFDKVALGKICKFVRGPFGGSLKKSMFVDKGYAVYEQQHAIYNQFDDLRYFINKEKFDEMKRFEVKSGDLIISCSGTMGKIAIVPQDIKRGIINQALLKLTVSNKIDNNFLKLWLESPIFQKTLSNYSKGVAIKNLVSVRILKEITINLPRLSIQKQIVKKLDILQEKTKKLEEIYNKKLQLAKELKQSILHKAFNGDL